MSGILFEIFLIFYWFKLTEGKSNCLFYTVLTNKSFDFQPQKVASGFNIENETNIETSWLLSSIENVDFNYSTLCSQPSSYKFKMN
jgi:hypothetical protein